jgi:hypothetical protein
MEKEQQELCEGKKVSLKSESGKGREGVTNKYQSYIPK